MIALSTTTCWGTLKKTFVIISHAMAMSTEETGRAIINHSPNETTGASGKEICEILAKAKFGGVPTKVEIPPMEHEYPMPNMTPVENPFVSLG